MKKTNWVVIIATGVFLGLFACAFIGIGFFVFPSLFPKPTYEVKYSVFGYGTITYINEFGNTEQIPAPSTGVWVKIFNAQSGSFVSVTSQSTSKYPSVSCFISVNDKGVKHSESQVAYGIATCSYTLP